MQNELKENSISHLDNLKLEKSNNEK